MRWSRPVLFYEIIALETSVLFHFPRCLLALCMTHLKLSREIFQGDPLFALYFVLDTKGLSRLLKRAEVKIASISLTSW